MLACLKQSKEKTMEIKSQPTMYVVNSNAIGDTVATLPILKDLINNYHKDGDYGIIALPQFRDLFFFIDNDHFYDINQQLEFKKEYSIKKLNIAEPDKTAYVVLPNQQPIPIKLGGQYLEPLRIHLSQYAGLQFSKKIYDISECSYLTYPINKQRNEEILDKFKIDFSKCVLINLTYRGATRIIPEETLIAFCNYIKEKGFYPLFVGKTETPDYVNDAPYKNTKFDTSIGLDLRDKTTLEEMIYVIHNSHSIIGVDNGLIHLASMTNTPIIASYTSCSPETRCPVRFGKLGGGIEIIEADAECRYCSDKWLIDGHDFNNCYYATNACCNSLNLEKFVKAFNKL